MERIEALKGEKKIGVKIGFKEEAKIAFKFCLTFSPLALLSGIAMAFYGLKVSPETLNNVPHNSKALLISVTILQIALYYLFCSFFGFILSNKVGLWRDLKFEKKKVLKVLLITFIGGVILSLDYFTFGFLYPEIKRGTREQINALGILSAVLYGGFIEEIMMRLFLLSFLIFSFEKLVFFLNKKLNREKEINQKVLFISVNIVVSLLFAIGHLPSTKVVFGSLTPLLLFRCFLFNGVFGYLFGYFYIEDGLHYSVLSHAFSHIVSKLILLFFI